VFDDLDLADFWERSDYAQQTYVDDPVTDVIVATVEKKLRCKLPPAYVALMRHQNGGMPKRARHRTNERTSRAKDHIAITGISAIGTKKDYSLCGENGSQFSASPMSCVVRLGSAGGGLIAHPATRREITIVRRIRTQRVATRVLTVRGAAAAPAFEIAHEVRDFREPRVEGRADTHGTLPRRHGRSSRVTI
jgi:hypothetical protein